MQKKILQSFYNEIIKTYFFKWMVFFLLIQKWQNSINFILPLKIIFIYLSDTNVIQIMDYNFEKANLLIYLFSFFILNLFSSLILLIITRYYTISLSNRVLDKYFKNIKNYSDLRIRFLRFSKLHLNHFSNIVFIMTIMFLFLFLDYKIFLISIFFLTFHILALYIPDKFFSDKGLKKYLKTDSYKEISGTLFWLKFVVASILLVPSTLEINKYNALIILLLSRFLFTTIVSSIKLQLQIVTQSKNSFKIFI